MLKVKHKKSIAVLLSALFIASSAGVNSFSVKADAADKELHNPVVELNECELVTFGKYWQEDTNHDGEFTDDEKQPIEWRVLKKYKEGNRTYALLLSDKVLDCKKFNDAKDGITWGKSSVREWLQSEFSGTAFEPGEEGIIKNVKHSENLRYKKNIEDEEWFEDVEECEDSVFLLSAEEAMDSTYGFNEDVDFFDPARETKATEYAADQGLSTSFGNEAPWWLRSEGKRSSEVPDDKAGSDHFASVDEYGVLDNKSGRVVDDDSIGIRPAIVVWYNSEYVVKGRTVALSEKNVKWDTVTLGKYNEKPLVWRVLHVDGNDAFLVTDDVIGKKKYNDVAEDITWKECSLRKWLNEDFYDSTFSSEEKGIIIPTTVKNGNYYYNVIQDDTTDKVTLLSLEDATNLEYGFLDKFTVASEPRTIYASYGDGIPWWLRSPGLSNTSVTVVMFNGSFAEEGYGMDNIDVSVRPAIHIDISKDSWEKGEPVYVGEGPEPTDAPTPTVTAGPEPTDSPTPTVTAGPEPTDSPTPTVTAGPEPTDAPTPTVTAGPEPTDAPTVKPTSGPTPASTPDPTDAPASTPEPTDAPTVKPTSGPTPTSTPEPTATPTATPDPLTVMGEDGTPYGKGASVEAAEKAITSLSSENDPAGTCYNVLQAKTVSVTKNAVKISWKKAPGAVKYQIYASKCGNNKPVLVASTTASRFTLEELNGKDLTKNTYYKLIVVAIDKDNKIISTSTMVHAATKGGKAGNVKKITTKAKKNKVSIKSGKSFKLKAKQKNEKKYKKHRVLKYESTNTDIATVSSSGVIKGIKKGKCDVYVYAQNGLSIKIKVTVK